MFQIYSDISGNNCSVLVILIRSERSAPCHQNQINQFKPRS